MFCKHNWEIVSTDYTPGFLLEGNVIDGSGVELASRAKAGTTHIYQKCTKCGAIQQKDVVGKFIKED